MQPQPSSFLYVTVCIERFAASTFSVFFFFFFFLPPFFEFGGQILMFWTVYTLFTHCAYTVHVLKNIKNWSHDTIYTFKNYFATVFSVFSNNKLNPNGPISCGPFLCITFYTSRFISCHKLPDIWPRFLVSNDFLSDFLWVISDKK